MAKLLNRTKSLNKLRPSRKEPSVPEYDVSESPNITSSRPTGNSSRVARLPDSVVKLNYSTNSLENKARPKTANEAMDRRMDLLATGSPISVTSGKDIFNFPTPLRRPLTPSTDARSIGMRSETSDIGIALGSPSHVVHFQSPLTSSPVQTRLTAPSKDIFTPVSTPGRSQTSHESRITKLDMNEPERPKLSRWRSLGGLFGRKSAPTGRQTKTPTLQQQTSPAPVDLKLKEYHTWETENPPNAVYTTSPQSPPKKKRGGRLGIGRSQTAPTNRRGSPIPPPKGPMLDVDIPNVEMERYSVMFNGVLPNRQPSLLARRQANSERTKQLQALELPPAPKRRSTTPEPSPSYRLLVFPPESSHSPRLPPQHMSTLHRPRPLRRSNTAPGALSPRLKEKSAEDEKPGHLSPMSETEELMDEDNRQALTPTPSEPSTPTTPTDRHSTHSFSMFDDARSSTWDPSLTEPNWEVITVGKVAEPGDRFSDAQFGPQVKVEGENEPEDWHHHGEHVQVQVARSMSVTRARKALLAPRRLDGTGKNGTKERLVERKPLTPTLVELVEVPGTNRKSVRVMIENA